MRMINVGAFPAACVHQCFSLTETMLFSQSIALCTDAKLALGVGFWDGRSLSLQEFMICDVCIELSSPVLSYKLN